VSIPDHEGDRLGHDAGMAGTGNDAIVSDREDRDGWTLEELFKDELNRGDAALVRTETKTSILLAVFSPIVTVGS
jgi:hypothetical protein